MKIRAILMATAAVAAALTLTTTASAAPAAGGDASAGGPEPAFSYCVKTYSAPHMASSNRVAAEGWYECDGPDPRQGQPVTVTIELWDRWRVWDNWVAVASGLGRAVYTCPYSNPLTDLRIRQKPGLESNLPCSHL